MPVFFLFFFAVRVLLPSFLRSCYYFRCCTFVESTPCRSILFGSRPLYVPDRLRFDAARNASSRALGNTAAHRRPECLASCASFFETTSKHLHFSSLLTKELVATTMSGKRFSNHYLRGFFFQQQNRHNFR